MAAAGDFHEIYPGATSYTAQRTDAILRHRGDLGMLFFDHLLRTVGIDLREYKVYPPKSAADLKKLHARISKSESPLHHKQSLIYYLLLDLADNHGHGNAGQYSSSIGLPQKYITLIHGLWSMDQLDFKHALDNLTSPILLPTLFEETLLVLCNHPKSDPSLVLAYFHAVAPEISDPDVLDKVFRCMCATSVTEAFFYSRQQGGTAHRHFFGELIKNVLRKKAGPGRAEMAEELVKLPFDAEEEKWFQEYLTLGDGFGLNSASDVLIMRLLLKGNTKEATRIAASNRERSLNGLSWNSLLKAS